MKLLKIQGIISLFLLIPFFTNFSFAQDDQSSDPGISAFIQVDKEPKPLNINEVKKRIGYPPKARRAGIQGQVVMRVLVDQKGNYVKHKTVKTDHSILSDRVELHISSLKFSPAIQKGRAIKFWVNIPFNFSLSGNKPPRLRESKVSLNIQENAELNKGETVSTLPSIKNFEAVKEKIGYPKFAHVTGIQGKIVAQALIDEKGKLIKRKILLGPHFTLVQAGGDYLKELEFSPALREGKPTQYWIEILFDFELEE